VRSLISKYPITSDKTCIVTVTGADARPCRVQLRPSEAIAWIYVAKRELDARLPADARWFPAIIDSGCNEGLFLHEWHLNHWFGLSERALVAQTTVPTTVYDKPVVRVRLDCWIATPASNEIKTPAGRLHATKISLGQHSLIGSLRNGEVVRHFPRKPLWQRLCDRLLASWESTETRRRKARDADALEYKSAIKSTMSQVTDVPYDLYPRLPLIGMRALTINNLLFNVDGSGRTFSLYDQNS
jgi:hypothetical protein